MIAAIRDRLWHRAEPLLKRLGFTVVRDAPSSLILYPAGHFHSPLPSESEVSEFLSSPMNENIAGVDLNEAGQEQLLTDLAIYWPEFDWPLERSAEKRYFLNNDMFLGADATQLYAMMRKFPPKHVIEVGSGFSSALMLDIADRHGIDAEFTFIEPFPDRLRSLLRKNDQREIIESRVQDVPLQVFQKLEHGDLLFIDSSHVAKIGSDVCFLFFEVLPQLQSGVIVHIHDIAWPFEYPSPWLRQGRAWNEAYFLRAFLQHNAAFEILLFNSWAAKYSQVWKQNAIEPMKATLGGSIWIRKGNEKALGANGTSN